MTPPVVLNEGTPPGPRPIEGVPTSIAAFIGRVARGPVNKPVRVESFRGYQESFGGLSLESSVGYAARDFFANGGAEAVVVGVANDAAVRDGLSALDKAAEFNLLCIPPRAGTQDLNPDVVGAAAAFCEKRRAFLLLDAPQSWKDATSAKAGIARGIGTTSANAAIYFPWLLQPDPLRGGQTEPVAPCGAVAGIIARMDRERGVWKAPAGQQAVLAGVTQLAASLTDAEIGSLNEIGINCLRSFASLGCVVWGARTLQGGDTNSDWKYVNIRRLALFLEESIDRGTRWTVFEPNGPPLWLQLQNSVGMFLQSLWRQGALQGNKPDDAFFVKCGRDTMTQNDIDNGIVNILIGIAPLRPAEFVIFRIQQMAQPGGR